MRQFVSKLINFIFSLKSENMHRKMIDLERECFFPCSSFRVSNINMIVFSR